MLKRYVVPPLGGSAEWPPGRGPGLQEENPAYIVGRVPDPAGVRTARPHRPSAPNRRAPGGAPGLQANVVGRVPDPAGVRNVLLMVVSCGYLVEFFKQQVCEYRSLVV